MKIIELILDDNQNDFVEAISLVTYPAIEDNFQSFRKDMSREDLVKLLNQNYEIEENDLKVIHEFLAKSKPKKDVESRKKYDKVLYEDGIPVWYQYVTRGAAPLLIDTSHEFCKKVAGKIYHVNEIKEWWGRMDKTQKEEYGFINDSNYFKDFNPRYVKDYNVNQQIFNCRHYLKKVTDISLLLSQVSKARIMRATGIRLESDLKLPESFDIDIKNFKKTKKTICGAIMIPDKLIYRNNIRGEECYVYFSKNTVRKMYEQFKIMKSTIQHQRDVEGIILSKSWIYTKDGNNYGYEFDLPDGTWVGEMKIANPQVWILIEKGVLKGFSIEVFASEVEKNRQIK